MYRFLPQRFRPILANAPTNYQIYGSPYVKASVTKQPEIDQNPTQIQQPKPKQLPDRTPHITPKDVGLPKNTNLYAYYNNRIGRTGNINRAGKPINKGQDYNATVNFTPNGEKLNIKISNGELIISDGSKVVTQQKLKADNYTQDAKLAIGKAIQKQREQLISDRKIRKHFTKEFIQSLKDLKKQGLLFKQGGNLNLIISEFLSKQK